MSQSWGTQAWAAVLVPEVLDEGAPAELEPPPDAVVVVVGGVGVFEVVGGVDVDGFGSGLGEADVGGCVTGGGLPPVSMRGGGGGEGWVTTVVVVLPSGLTDTTVVGTLGDVGLDVAGAPLEVAGSLGDGVAGSVRTPAGTVPWPPGPPVPPAVEAVPGPASSATAANAVATTSPATPSTTYPVRFGLLLLGGAVSILVIRALESDPSGRGIRGSLGSVEAAQRGGGTARGRGSGALVRMEQCAHGGGATSAGRLSPACGHSPR